MDKTEFDFENKLNEMSMKYSEYLSSIKMIREAASNESDTAELSDISKSLNLIAEKMENTNTEFDIYIEQILKALGIY